MRARPLGLRRAKRVVQLALADDWLLGAVALHPSHREGSENLIALSLDNAATRTGSQRAEASIQHLELLLQFRDLVMGGALSGSRLSR